MEQKVRMAFEQRGILLPLDRILPRKQLKPSLQQTHRYQRIVASMRIVGLVEPLLVFPLRGRKGQYLLLDGHIRLLALKEMGESEAFCLIATDDEAFTYNHHVCLMTSIQEHFMISRAIERGVAKEKIAQALVLNVDTIRKKQKLLEGICAEAVELLKEKPIGGGTLREFRRLRPMRQIEMAELMIAANNFTEAYAKCLVAASPAEEIIETDRPKAKKQFSAADLARIEREMDVISREMRSLEEMHGRNVLNLVIVVSYMRKLLANAAVVKYLAKKHADFLGQFQKIIESSSLDGTIPESAVPSA